MNKQTNHFREYRDRKQRTAHAAELHDEPAPLKVSIGTRVVISVKKSHPFPHCFHLFCPSFHHSFHSSFLGLFIPSFLRPFVPAFICFYHLVIYSFCHFVHPSFHLAFQPFITPSVPHPIHTVLLPFFFLPSMLSLLLLFLFWSFFFPLCHRTFLLYLTLCIFPLFHHFIHLFRQSVVPSVLYIIL